MHAESLLELVKHMLEHQVATTSSLVGCTDAEIAAIETKYSVRLPAAYRSFLALMGQESGRLFTHDHVGTSYQYVLGETESLRRFLDSGRAEPPSSFELPRDALVILTRDLHCQFIRCNDPEDSPVWYFNIGEWSVAQCNTSITEWLRGWCTAAEGAIRRGYFDVYPKGTTPY
jgi:SMI1 / KNR4 family (SUKH-1)